MDHKPDNFYIGLVELFAVFLPGFILSIFIYITSLHYIESPISIDSNTVVFTILLFLSSYLLGNILFQIGSLLDSIYDKTKDFFFRDKQRLLLIKKIRKNTNPSSDDTERLVSNYEWARARLIKELPSIISVIDRYMADSKFFRSLIILLFSALVLSRILIDKLSIEFGCLALLVFAFYLFYTKRHKATETAYKYLIFLEENGGKISSYTIENISQLSKSSKNEIRNIKSDKEIKTCENSIIPQNQEEIIKQYFGEEKGYKNIIVNPNSCLESFSPFVSNNKLLCIEGKGIFKIKNGQKDTNICFSPLALFEVKKDTAFVIENNGTEPILIVYKESK